MDAGNPSDRPVGADPEGNPGIVDGNLDGTVGSDMGGYEHTTTNLAVSGDTVPGGDVTIDTTGPVSNATLMFLGLGGQSSAYLNHFGNLLVDLANPWMLVPWPSTPSSVSGTLPSDLPPGTQINLQAADFGTGYTVLSGVEEVSIYQ